jgi:glucose/arabinose dehydrogenase/mono/diheme cytochrome c family protein
MRIAESLSRRALYAGLIIGLLTATGLSLVDRDEWPATARPVCTEDNGGLTLPPGFCATVFADNIGHARHLVVAPNGVVYVNTWSGRYYGNDTPPAGGFLVALRDTTGNGRADVVQRFGDSVQTGGTGGTGITVYRGALFAEANDRIVRYSLPSTGIVPTEAPTVILSGLPLTGDHPMHPFVIDAQGAMYVNSGSATNACQVQNRIPNSPGGNPCTELKTRAGIWRYDANRPGQRFSPAERFVTGLRNSGGIAIDPTGTALYATQHGRDQLRENWSVLYTPEQGASEPAEELVRLERGADYGWPECYYDYMQQKLVLAPEYGGDGGHAIGVCAQKRAPVATFPGHWAPNDATFYSGNLFPERYRGGVFIAFHGSWNRAPFPQGGYNVVFQPFAQGKPAGQYEVFADGFAGAVKEPGSAAHRPAGLAVGPDGVLYISDDVRGRIWRIVSTGAVAATRGVPASNRSERADDSASAAPAQRVGPPEGTHPDAGSNAAGLPTPKGATAEMVAQGDRLYHANSCVGCHGPDATGSPQGSNLTRGKWLWGDGSLASIARTITQGVPHPREHTGVMPPLGGAPLSSSDVSAIAAYIAALKGHADARSR